jgi:hypothetical protein
MLKSYSTTVIRESPRPGLGKTPLESVSSDEIRQERKIRAKPPLKRGVGGIDRG